MSKKNNISSIWNKRYATNGKNKFFCGDGVMIIGDRHYPVEEDYRKDTKGSDGRIYKTRGGTIKFPNGWNVHVSWGHNRNGDNKNADNGVSGKTFNETPETAEIRLTNPNGQWDGHPDDDERRKRYPFYPYHTTERANALIDRVKEI